MTSGTLKGIGAGCFLACAILAFFAWNSYNENAKNVEAFNQGIGNPFGAGNDVLGSFKIGGESPFGGLLKQATGSSKLEPGVPTATKVCGALAILSVLGGIGCFVMAPKLAPPLDA